MKEAFQLIESLKNDEYAPVYFLHGEESYYIDLISDYVEDHALDEAAKGFNQVIVYGKDLTMADMLQHARRYPMMSNRQVVIVKEAQNIIDFGQEDAQRMLESYLNNPLATTILVLCYKHKSIDRRKKVFKALEKQAVVLQSKPLYDNQVPVWIRDYMKSRGFRVSEKAVHMLAENIGTNLQRLANEIDKMLINFNTADIQHGKKPIVGKEVVEEVNEHHIQKYVGISKEYNAFELQRAVMFKDILKAGRIVQYFESNPKNSSVIPVIGVLYSMFSKLLTLHNNKAYSDQQIIGELKINRYFVGEYKAGLQNYNLAKVIESIHHLRKADLMSKGVFNTSVSDGQILKELVYKLIH